MNSDKKHLILELYRIGSIQFGEFTLKSGLKSPFYIDLRRVVSYPALMKHIKKLFKSITAELSFDLITGIPYTALPIASLLSVYMNKPLIYPRKEVKAYGTARQIEGVFEEGQSCLVLDDVMSTGESKIEIAEILEKNGLRVEEFVVLIDRSYAGQNVMKEHGYRLHSVVTISDILNVLETEKLITKDQLNAVSSFLSYDTAMRTTSLRDRVGKSPNIKTRSLLERMFEKKSNLILSLDVDNQDEFFSILERVAEYIVMVKTHIDILSDFSPQFIDRLKNLSERSGFLIFEDRKFADIGSTVRKQFREGIYRIADWADFITVHLLPGPGILKGLFEQNPRTVGAFLLAAMSAEGNLLSDAYARQVVAISRQYKEYVSGFIGFGSTETELKKLKNKIPEDTLLLTPGVHIEQNSDGLGQQYISVKEAIRGGADAIIVGRGIYASGDPVNAARTYREKAWKEFIKRGT